VQGRARAGVAAVRAGPGGVVDPVVAGVHLGVPGEGVGGRRVDLEQGVGEQHPRPGQQGVQAQPLGGAQARPDAAAAAVLQGRGQGARGGEHHLGHVVGVGGQVGGRHLPTPGVPDQHHPVGADAAADGLQVGHLTGDGVAAGVGQPRRAAGADLVVDPDVVAVGGQLPEVGGVAGHVGDPGPAMEEHHRRGSWPAGGRHAEVGDARAGGQGPLPLPGHRRRRQPWVAGRQQDRDHEHGHPGQGRGGEPGQPGPPAPGVREPAGGQGHPGGHGRQEDGQARGQEPPRPGRQRRRPGQRQQPGHGRGHQHGQQPGESPEVAPHRRQHRPTVPVETSASRPMSRPARRRTLGAWRSAYPWTG
jgi:hypothetical protein